MAESGASLLAQVLPSRSAAKKANQKFLSQLSSDDEHNARTDRLGERSRPNDSTTHRYTSKTKTRGSARKLESMNSLPLQSPRPSKPTQMLKGTKRKTREPPSTLYDAELESLTSLSSLSSDSDAELARSAPPITPTTTPKSKSTTAKTMPSLRTPIKTKTRTAQTLSKDSWNLSCCASFVFVLLDTQGQAIDNRLDAPGAKLWWPGKVANVSPYSIPLCITVYNQITPSSPRIVKLNSPSPSNLQPIHRDRRSIRFEESNFAVIALLRPPTRSPSKKAKINHNEAVDADIVGKWKEALKQMMSDCEDEGDDGALSTLGHEGVEDKRQSLTPPLDEELSSSSFVPPPPDPTLEIPGELLLAREKVDAPTHWPAKLLAYLAPSRSSQKPKYRVEFLDKSIRAIPREWFFTSEEEGFATCKIGQWESSYREDSGSESECDDDGITDAKAYRFQSPVPTIPPPSPSEFGRLPIAHQFAYVKPILLATLNETYAPARQRHEDFLKGGKHRADVMRDVAMHGIIPGEEVSKLTQCLCAWALGDANKTGAGEGGELLVENNNCRDEIVGGNEAVFDRDPQEERHAWLPADYLETTSLSPASAPPSSLPVTERRSSPSPSIAQSQNAADVDSKNEDVYDESSGNSNLSDKSTDPKTPGGKHEELTIESSHTQPLLPRGCAAYEALAGVEKLEYVLNVLHYELILQIILWRTGKRTSLQLLSPAEEDALRDVAQEESLATDWVFDITRLRASKYRLMKARKGQKENIVVVGGTRSRPKTIANGDGHT